MNELYQRYVDSRNHTTTSSIAQYARNNNTDILNAYIASKTKPDIQKDISLAKELLDILENKIGTQIDQALNI